MPLTVRPETQADTQAISRVIQAAFAAKTHLHHHEHAIVSNLRSSNNLSLSLVASKDSTIIGHIAISPVQVQDQADWYGLGPLAVHPDHQRRGVGSLLVRRAMEELGERGAAGCVVLGRPEFYARFGFVREHGLWVEGAPRRFFMMRTLREVLVPVGQVRYCEAFDVESEGPGQG